MFGGQEQSKLCGPFFEWGLVHQLQRRNGIQSINILSIATEKIECLFKLTISFTGKADQNINCHLDPGAVSVLENLFSRPTQKGLIHERQNAIRSRFDPEHQ